MRALFVESPLGVTSLQSVIDAQVDYVRLRLVGARLPVDGARFIKTGKSVLHEMYGHPGQRRLPEFPVPPVRRNAC